MRSAQYSRRSQTAALKINRTRVWARYTAALALVFAMVGSSAPRAASSNSGKGSANGGSGQGLATAEEHRAHVDEQLANRLGRGNDAESLRVIITVQPGAKRGLIRALQAQGATVSDDFTIIEAVAAELPVGLLRALQRHPDVVAISSDAEVHSTGISSSVSGRHSTPPTACGAP